MPEKKQKGNIFDAVGGFIKNASDTVIDTAGKIGTAVVDTAGIVGSTVADTAGKVGSAIGDVAGNVGSTAGDIAGKIGAAANDAAGNVADLAGSGRNVIMNVFDVNGSGSIDIEDFIILGLRIPGIGIDRESFLRTELKKGFSKEVIDDAVKYTPAHAGIPIEAINKLADDVIAYERNCVSGIATVLGMPGGFMMAATIPADIAQYYGFMLRAAQKLLYLYGFPEIDVSEKGQVFDSETLNMMTLCLGVMYGVAGANKALIAMANALAKGVEKKLLNAALTKGAIYPIVKKVAKWFGTKMTKQMFAGFFKKAIPVVGGVIGGSITYLSFKPCCDKLRDTLKNTNLSNPQEYVADEEVDVFDIDIDEQGEELDSMDSITDI